jgi:hypothetical protein
VFWQSETWILPRFLLIAPGESQVARLRAGPHSEWIAMACQVHAAAPWCRPVLPPPIAAHAGTDRSIARDCRQASYYPPEETGFELETAFPAVHAWRQRLAALPGWKAPQELMPVGTSPAVRVA